MRRYESLVDEVEHLREGVDSFEYGRFQLYLQHIPSEYWAEWRGNIVMQRPWRRDDAEFCYRFAARTVIQWQNTERSPLHEHDLSGLPDWGQRFGGIRLRDHQHILTYYQENDLGGNIEVFVVGEDEKVALESLTLNRSYDYVREHLYDGIVGSRMFQRVLLRNRLVRHVTHDPARWEVILLIDPVPLTWYRQDFEGGEMTAETPCINSATVEQIVDVYPDVISLEIAERIVDIRERHGPFRTRQDLEHVAGITNQQLDWLCSFTRSEPAPLAPAHTDRTT